MTKTCDGYKKCHFVTFTVAMLHHIVCHADMGIVVVVVDAGLFRHIQGSTISDIKFGQLTPNHHYQPP